MEKFGRWHAIGEYYEEWETAGIEEFRNPILRNGQILYGVYISMVQKELSEY
jgi:hypothetical protein